MLAVMPMLMIVGCKKDVKNQTSNVRFKLTDAPGQFDALNIDVQAIRVHSEANGWVTMQSSLGVINVMNYVNGSSTLIAEGDLQSGTIDQVRLVLGSNNSVVVNGVSHPLQATGNLTSGLTLDLHNTLQAGGSYEWTIDFDAAQSIIASSTSNFQLSPVIRLIVDGSSTTAGGSTTGAINIGGSTTGTTTGGINIGGSTSGSGTGTIDVGGSTSGSGSGTISVGGSGSTVVNGSTTGNISGSLSLAALASVCVTGSNGTSVCTMTDLSGHFTIQAVSSGSYSLTVTPTLGLMSSHTISNVSVTAGQTTNLGVIAM